MVRARLVGAGLVVMGVLLGVAGPRPAIAAEASVVNAAAATITKPEVKRFAEVLADDSFEGRGMGTRGGRAAGGYIVNELQKMKLTGVGDDGTFFQSYSGGSRNILALLEGSDPELKKQYVIIGAHYDHVGYGNSSNSYGPTGYIHNGADDNASGVSGLLEIAQAYTSLPEPPKRSVIFAFWDGEEAGLLGSKHWMGRPTVPTKNIALYINLDMIGRLRRQRVEVYGTRSSHGLRQLISRQNPGDLWLDFTWEMKENSDHWTFFERNFPTLMFHTGLHDNYHRPSDDVHLLNTDGIAQVARLVFAVSNAVADDERTMKFRGESRREDPAGKRAFEQVLAPPGPRLGMEWKDPQGEETGVVVTRVSPGLPAAKAGILVGDRVIKFGGHDVTAKTPLRMEVLAARTPVEVQLIRGEQKEPLTLSVQLLGSPSRLGVTWREDSAEPGTLFLTQVQPGSAAHRAGLKERDRVYEIGGQRFASGSEFRKLATTLPSPLDVTIERGGRIYTLTIEAPDVVMAK